MIDEPTKLYVTFIKLFVSFIGGVSVFNCL